MGACNALETFQSFMNQIFHDFIDYFLILYIDDLLVFSKDEESHFIHLEMVLEILK